MKHLIILFFAFFLLHCNVLAQYSKFKTELDYREYHYQSGDKYHPAVAGVASYFFPGLGQVYSGEVWRGLAFFGGTAGAFSIGMTGALISLSEGNGSFNNSSFGYPLMVSGFLLTTGLLVWSIADAVRVAKVKNLYYRNGDYGQFKIRVSPTLLGADQHDWKFGIGMSIQF